MHSKKSIIINFFKTNLLLIVGSFLFGFCSIVITILIPIFLGKFYQLAMHSGSARGKIFDSFFGKVDNMNSYFMLFSIVMLLKLVFNYLQSFLTGITTELFTKQIREKLFNKQLITQLNIFEKKATGNYLLRYSGDLSSINNYISKGIIGFVNDVLFITITLLIFFSINTELSLALLISFPLIFLLVFLIIKKLKTFTSKRRNLRSTNLAFIASRLTALSTIKAFNREQIETQKFQKKSDKLYENDVKYQLWFALVDSLLPFLLYSMLGVILFIAYTLSQSNTKELAGSQILVFIMLTVSTIPVFKRILKVNIVWQNGNLSFKKLLVIFNNAEEEKNSTEQLNISIGSIEFNNLSIGYGENNKIFENFNAFIPEFGTYYLEGYQGGGKSFLFKILLGLYKPLEGKIIIDKVDINKLSEFTLRKNVTITSNDLALLGNTIFEAISYSRKEEKKPEALKLLAELGFEIDTNSILDFPLIDGGKNLSAGQRKILLISRALLTKKKIILLDEPFSDLDEVYKNKLIIVLNKLNKVRTIVIIDKEKNNKLLSNGIIKLPLKVIKN